MNFLCFSLSELSSFFPFKSERLAGRSAPVHSCPSFSTSSCPFPLVCEASAESSADGLMGLSLCVAGFLLAVFRILTLAFVIFNTSCRGSLGSSCLDLSVLTGPGCLLLSTGQKSFWLFLQISFLPRFFFWDPYYGNVFDIVPGVPKLSSLFFLFLLF